MDIEFHYHITGFIAEKAGFSQGDARTIAYASQYVDDNTAYLKVRDPSTGETFRNHISQTLDIGKPQQELMRIWPVFHYVPGDPAAPEAQRKDGLMHVMNTTPGSRMATEMLEDAFNAPAERLLHRIGIATHAFADTWAHQNFVGAAAEFNNIPGRVLLNIGHLDAATDPDLVKKRWKDSRLVVTEANNNERFLKAAEALYTAYCAHLGRDCGGWSSCAETLTGLMSQPRAKRKRYYRSGIPWLPKYEKQMWMKAAAEDEDELFAASFGLFKWKGNPPKEETDWYRFQVAVEEHEALGVNLLKNLHAQTGVSLLGVL